MTSKIDTGWMVSEKTLLDEFAIAALADDGGHLGTDTFNLRVKICEIEGWTMAECVARECYEQATAMIAEKRRRESQE